ncbi:LysR family transcriptional regulator [Conservatibacter flavescens]|uniref:LysR family transcriptional regulator n=1 Tax=Conservatibacter flavescens TaxID=28161 RepID=A0A2M8RZQ8_9PAST|nr:LysR family transcriptional regulator [Conservatibacter flavescens]PJG84380.1 LysR family transcriptional regulator [Conservatibacter flavescens]
MEITYRQLKAFTILVQEQSMIKAAEKCFVTQSALSQSIKRLSEQLNCILFIRQGNRLILTESGKRFYQYALDIVNKLEQFQAYSGQYQFKISGLYSVSASLIPMTIYALKQEHDSVEFILQENKVNNITQLVLTGAVDIGVNIKVEQKDLEFLPLFKDYMCFLCPEDHPLADRELVSWENIHSFVNIGVEQNTSIRHLVEQTYEQLNLNYQPSFNIHRAETIVGMVQNKLGCSILSSMFAFLKKHERVKFIPIEDPRAYREIGLVKRKDYHHPMITLFYHQALNIIHSWSAVKENYIGPIGSPNE